MKPCSRLGILGILTVPVLFAPFVLTGPTYAATTTVGIPITASHPPNSPDSGGMAGMHDMPGMDGTHDMPGMPGMPGMENIPGMESTPESTPPADQGDMSGMEGMEDMPGMESTPEGNSGHSEHGTSDVVSNGPEPARGVVLAGFGIFNLLVLLVAAVVRYSGSGSRRSRRNAARSASEPTSTRHKPKTGQLPS